MAAVSTVLNDDHKLDDPLDEAGALAGADGVGGEGVKLKLEPPVSKLLPVLKMLVVVPSAPIGENTRAMGGVGFGLAEKLPPPMA